jgi:hypothetical protein
VKPLLPALLLLAALAAPSLGEETAAIDIVRNPSAYSGRFVTVRGVMTNVRPETGGGIQRPMGTVFNLVAGPAILVVLSTVPPGCPIGSTVTVNGRFVPMAQIRQQLYTNLIEATSVACR